MGVFGVMGFRVEPGWGWGVGLVWFEVLGFGCVRVASSGLGLSLGMGCTAHNERCFGGLGRALGLHCECSRRSPCSQLYVASSDPTSRLDFGG